MPMMTKDWMGLPVAPFHSPERTRSEKAFNSESWCSRLEMVEVERCCCAAEGSG